MQPHQERVVAEQVELQGKLDKLYAFTVGEVYKTLPEAEGKLLQEQLQHMIAYNHVLLQRIDLFREAA